MTRLAYFYGEILRDNLRVAGRYVYFNVYRPDSTSDIWRSDGTPEGTIELAKSAAFIGDELAVAGDAVLFRRHQQVWRTDGTPEGTYPLNHSSGGVVSDGKAAWFINEEGLWQTDGSIEGTIRIGNGARDGSLGADQTGRLFIFERALQQTHVSVIEGGTRSRPFTIPAGLRRLSKPIFAAGPVLYLHFDQPATGTELWRTDGTPEGTRIVSDVAPGPASGWAAPITTVNGRILLRADDAQHGGEPWITDGTAAGTVMLNNIAPEGSLRGRVRDRDSGRRVAGAVIEVWSESTFLGEFTVNDDGDFNRPIRDGEYKLKAKSTTHVKQLWKEKDCPDCFVDKAARVQVSAGKDAEVEFHLNRGGTIEGRVVDAAGNPVAGLPVIAAQQYRAQTPAAETRTAADGTYVLGGLPPEAKWLVYIPEDRHVPAERRFASVIYPGVGCTGGCDHPVPGATHLSLEAGETLRGIDFVVRPLGKVRIRLVDVRTGAPPSQVMRVEFFHVEQTDFEEGVETVWTRDTAEVSLPDGRYHILAVQRFAGEPFGSAWYPNVPCEHCNQPQGEVVTPVAGETLEITIYVTPNRPPRRRAAR